MAKVPFAHDALHDNVSYRAVFLRIIVVKLFFIFSLLSLNSWAVEVTTLSVNKVSANEMTLVSTDENFTSSMEKHFMARACKLRSGMNSIVPLKEIWFPQVCRAEIIQFLLNNGYKADPHYYTFVK